MLCAATLALASIAMADNDSAAPAAKKAAWPATAAATKRGNEKGVPNFGKLNDNVWRSGQPTADGYKSLAAKGLKTVVNLREEFPGDKDLLPEGVKYVYIPVKDENAPTAEQAKQFVDVVSNPDNWPVLVHCKGGEGRAGVFSAVVRHSFDGWKHDEIMREMGNYRIKHFGFMKMPVPACQTNFIQKWEDTPAAQIAAL